MKPIDRISLASLLRSSTRKPWATAIAPLNDEAECSLQGVFEPAAIDVLESLELSEFSWQREGSTLPLWGRENVAEPILPWSVPRSTARLLFLLVMAARPRTIIEIGTSRGYSALWLAQAAMNLGAHLHTVEAMQDKARDARSHLSAARVANWTLHQREAADFCASWNEPIDFLFLDADAIAYCGYWRLLRPHLSTRAVIVADNALTHPHLLAPFVDLLEADGGFHSYLEPLDNGLLLAYARAVNANKEG